MSYVKVIEGIGTDSCTTLEDAMKQIGFETISKPSTNTVIMKYNGFYIKIYCDSMYACSNSASKFSGYSKSYKVIQNSAKNEYHVFIDFMKTPTGFMINGNGENGEFSLFFRDEEAEKSIISITTLKPSVFNCENGFEYAIFASSLISDCSSQNVLWGDSGSVVTLPVIHGAYSTNGKRFITYEKNIRFFISTTIKGSSIGTMFMIGEDAYIKVSDYIICRVVDADTSSNAS